MECSSREVHWRTGGSGAFQSRRGRCFLLLLVGLISWVLRPLKLFDQSVYLKGLVKMLLLESFMEQELPCAAQGGLPQAVASMWHGEVVRPLPASHQNALHTHLRTDCLIPH